jgi:hypothetical protein
LKANEPQVGQQHEDVEKKQKTTTLLFSLKGLDHDRVEILNFSLRLELGGRWGSICLLISALEKN